MVAEAVYGEQLDHPVGRLVVHQDFGLVGAGRSAQDY